MEPNETYTIKQTNLHSIFLSSHNLCVYSRIFAQRRPRKHVFMPSIGTYVKQGWGHFYFKTLYQCPIRLKLLKLSVLAMPNTIFKQQESLIEASHKTFFYLKIASHRPVWEFNIAQQCKMHLFFLLNITISLDSQAWFSKLKLI